MAMVMDDAARLLAFWAWLETGKLIVTQPSTCLWLYTQVHAQHLQMPADMQRHREPVMMTPLCRRYLYPPAAAARRPQHPFHTLVQLTRLSHHAQANTNTNTEVCW